MRAARLHDYGAPENLLLEDVPVPVCGPGDILIRVVCAATNPVDYKIRQGSQQAVVRLKLPAILGMDVAGVVAATGSAVTAFEVGDRVFSSPHHKTQGCYAEFVAIDASEVAKMPESMSFEDAAGIPLAGLTAYACLVDCAKVKPGDRVLIQAGSGGVGTLAIQIAKALGCEVAATCSERNVELVRSLGADRVVDYTKEQFEDVLEPQDVVLESLGGEVQERSLQVLKRGGTLASINSGMVPRSRKYGPTLGFIATVLATIITIVGQALRGRRFRPVVRKPDGKQLEQLSKWVSEGKLRAVNDRVVPLEEIAEAHRYQASGRGAGEDHRPRGGGPRMRAGRWSLTLVLVIGSLTACSRPSEQTPNDPAPSESEPVSEPALAEASPSSGTPDRRPGGQRSYAGPAAPACTSNTGAGCACRSVWRHPRGLRVRARRMVYPRPSTTILTSASSPVSPTTTIQRRCRRWKCG